MIVRPGPADLYRVSKLQRGHLSQVPFPLLLRALHHYRRSVAVDLRHGDVLKTVTLRSGVLVACESNQPHEWIGALIRECGRISASELDSLLGEAAGRGVPLGQILLRRRLLSEEELERFLRQGLASKLFEVFGWDDGVFFLRPAAGARPPVGELRVERLILTGILRFCSDRTIAAFRRRVGGEPLGLDPGVVPSTKVLEPTARRIVEVLDDGPCTLDELVAATGLPAADVAKLAYGLGILGLVGTTGELLLRDDDTQAHDTQPFNGSGADGSAARASEPQPATVAPGDRRLAAPSLLAEAGAAVESAGRVRLLEDMRLRGVSVLGFEMRREPRRKAPTEWPEPATSGRAPGLRYLDP